MGVSIAPQPIPTAQDQLKKTQTGAQPLPVAPTAPTPVESAGLTVPQTTNQGPLPWTPASLSPTSPTPLPVSPFSPTQGTGYTPSLPTSTPTPQAPTPIPYTGPQTGPITIPTPPPIPNPYTGGTNPYPGGTTTGGTTSTPPPGAPTGDPLVKAAGILGVDVNDLRAAQTALGAGRPATEYTAWIAQQKQAGAQASASAASTPPVASPPPPSPVPAAPVPVAATPSPSPAPLPLAQTQGQPSPVVPASSLPSALGPVHPNPIPAVSPGVSTNTNSLLGQTITPSNDIDRVAIAKDLLSQFDPLTEAKFREDLDRSSQQAAGMGQLGSGMWRSSLAKVAGDRAQQRDAYERQVIDQALGGKLDDYYKNIGIAQQQQGFQAGQQRAAFDQTMATRAADLQEKVANGQLSLQQAAQELQRQAQAFGQDVTQIQLEDYLTNSDFNRSMSRLQAGESNDPYSLGLALSQMFGNQAGAAGSSAASLLGQAILAQALGQGGGGSGGGSGGGGNTGSNLLSWLQQYLQKNPGTRTETPPPGGPTDGGPVNV